MNFSAAFVSVRRYNFLAGTVLAFALFLNLSAADKKAEASNAPKYIFLMIGDGMGSGQRMAAEKYLADVKENKSVNQKTSLFIESLPYSSMTVTDSKSGVTDSAAAGTAIACGFKTNNGMLGMLPDGKSVYSIASDLQKKNMKIGIITDAQINDATPAAFYAHVSGRGKFADINSFIGKSGFELLAGDNYKSDGGNPSETDKIIENSGYKVFRNYNEFKFSKSEEFPKAVLIHHIPFAIDDSNALEVPLTKLLKDSIKRLEGENGFFIMIEGGKIDWACHDNDIATAVKEVLAFDETVKVAYDFFLANPQDTLLVVTADHETGGLEVPDEIPDFKEIIDSQKSSFRKFLEKLNDLKKKKAAYSDFLAAFDLEFKLYKFTDKESEKLKQAWDTFMNTDKFSRNPVIQACSEIMAGRCSIKWTAGQKHSGAKIKTLAIGRGADSFKSGLLSMENTDIPAKIRRIMSLPPPAEQ